MYEPVIYLIQEFLLSTYELVLYITIYTYIILYYAVKQLNTLCPKNFRSRRFSVSTVLASTCTKAHNLNLINYFDPLSLQ